MNFFCKKEDYDQWVEDMQVPEDEIFCLNLREAREVSKMIFSVTDI